MGKSSSEGAVKRVRENFNGLPFFSLTSTSEFIMDGAGLCGHLNFHYLSF